MNAAGHFQEGLDFIGDTRARLHAAIVATQEARHLLDIGVDLAERDVDPLAAILRDALGLLNAGEDCLRKGTNSDVNDEAAQ